MNKFYKLFCETISRGTRAVERYFDKRIKIECSKIVEEMERYGVTRGALSKWENIQYNLIPARDLFNSGSVRLELKVLNEIKGEKNAS
jgi:hypothetical protein